MTRNRTLLYPPRNQPTCAGELGNIARVFRLSKNFRQARALDRPVLFCGRRTPSCFRGQNKRHRNRYVFLVSVQVSSSHIGAKARSTSEEYLRAIPETGTAER